MPFWVRVLDGDWFEVDINVYCGGEIEVVSVEMVIGTESGGCGEEGAQARV